jgi:hypothetical protein
VLKSGATGFGFNGQAIGNQTLYRLSRNSARRAWNIGAVERFPKAERGQNSDAKR